MYSDVPISKHSITQVKRCYDDNTINRPTPMLAWVVIGRLPYQRHSTSAGKIITLYDVLSFPSWWKWKQIGRAIDKQSRHTPTWALALPPWDPPPPVRWLVPPPSTGPPSCANTRQHGAKINVTFLTTVNSQKIVQSVHKLID